MRYIDFPVEEHKALKERLDDNKIIYTTRVSDEVGKYTLDEIYSSPFGCLKVISFKHYNYITDHPFIDELTEEQIDEINEYINENGFDIIGLKKV